jgi:hypothetical protein
LSGIVVFIPRVLRILSGDLVAFYCLLLLLLHE